VSWRFCATRSSHPRDSKSFSDNRIRLKEDDIKI
jgi:hypothetical protein